MANRADNTTPRRLDERLLVASLATQEAAKLRIFSQLPQVQNAIGEMQIRLALLENEVQANQAVEAEARATKKPISASALATTCTRSRTWGKWACYIAYWMFLVVVAVGIILLLLVTLLVSLLGNVDFVNPEVVDFITAVTGKSQ